MNDPLGLDPDTMRRLGYQTVDMLVDRLSGVADGPVIRSAGPRWSGAELRRVTHARLAAR